MTSIDLTTEDGMLTYLQQEHFPKCSNTRQLTGGWGGFVYRATTGDPMRPTVVVKHAEGYAARTPEWKLNVNRMDFEAKAIKLLSEPDMQSGPIIRIPKLLHYDRQWHVLIMEDAGDLPSLKNWTTDTADLKNCTRIGEAVGRFLAHLHNATAGNRELLKEFNGNETAKTLSGKLYYGGLAKAAEEYGHTDNFISDAAKVAEEEIHTRQDVLTFGDFWTGNVLVSTKVSEDPHLYVLDLELSKPGTAEFDIGQMAAEMWCLANFRKNAREQSMTLISAFIRSYQATRADAVDVAKVAIRVGAHLTVIMPIAWSIEAAKEQIRDAVAEGREFIRMGWERDNEALAKSILKPLLR